MHSNDSQPTTEPFAAAWLPQAEFESAVGALPLVSVDWVLSDPQGRVLTGYRLNAPARGSWFTPGGRVRKGEPLAQALVRVLQTELGLVDANTAQSWLQRAELIGAWDHFYEDSAFGADVPTHYVNLPHWLMLSDDEVAGLNRVLGMVGAAPAEACKTSASDGASMMEQQHHAWRWLTAAEDAKCPQPAHRYVQPYLQWVAARMNTPLHTPVNVPTSSRNP